MLDGVPYLYIAMRDKWYTLNGAGDGTGWLDDGGKSEYDTFT
jgi:hypothetical protein